MTRGITLSRRRVVACIASAIAAIGALLAHIECKGALHRENAEGARLEREAASQIASLSAFDDAQVQRLRDNVVRFRQQLGESGTWPRLLRHLGGRWHQETLATAERGGYRVETGTIELASPAVSDWPDIVDAVKYLEQAPGVGVGEIEMEAAGTGVQRGLELVRVVVVIRIRRLGRETVSQ